MCASGIIQGACQQAGPHKRLLSAGVHIFSHLFFHSLNRSNFLHSRNLREMADLHRQLVRTLATMHMRQLWKLEGTHEEGAGKPPPSASPGTGGGVEGVGAASASVVAGLARALLACVGAAGAAPGAGAKAGKKAAGAKAGSGAGELLAVVTQKPSPPTRIQECLRRAVAAGWADQVSELLC